jgi:hypothetical protein
MDKQREKVLHYAGLFLLGTSAIAPAFMKSSSVAILVYLFVTLPCAYLSGILLYIGNPKATDRQRKIPFLVVAILSLILTMGNSLSYQPTPFFLFLCVLLAAPFILVFIYRLGLAPGMLAESPLLEREILVDLPVDRTRELCIGATKLLPDSPKPELDREKKHIYVEISSALMTSVIRMCLEEVAPGRTRLTLSARTPHITEMPELVSEWNSEYIDTISDYVLNIPQLRDHPVGPSSPRGED